MRAWCVNGVRVKERSENARLRSRGWKREKRRIRERVRIAEGYKTGEKKKRKCCRRSREEENEEDNKKRR